MAQRRVWNAFDGDSLKTKNGTNRFQTGNAPELGQPGGEAATRAVQFELNNGARVEDTGEQGFRGRDLVNLRDEQGRIGPDLVRRGLLNPASDDETQLPGRELLQQELTGETTRPELNEFVRQSREEEKDAFLNNLDQVLKNTERQELPDDKTGSVTGRALSRGVDQLQGTLFGFANAVGEATGSDPLAKFGEEGLKVNLLEAARNPAEVNRVDDIDGLEDLGIFTLETIASEAPQFGVDIGVGLASGGLGALGSVAARRTALAGIGKAVARRTGGAEATASAGTIGRKALRARQGIIQNSLQGRSGQIGLIGSIESQLVGETRQSQFAQGLEDEDGAVGTAFGTGTLKAGLEFAGIQKILGNVFRGSDSSTQNLITGLVRGNRDAKGFFQSLKRVAQLGGSAGLTEGITEGSQSLIDQLSEAGLDPDRNADLANVDVVDILDGAARGAIFGGSATGIGAAVTSIADNARSVRQAQNERALLDDTVPERRNDLLAQARVKDRVFVSRNQSPDQVDEVRETMSQRGDVRVREGEDGTLISLNETDPLIDSDEALTRERFLAERGQQTASNTQGNLATAFVEDSEGNRIEERTVTDETVDEVRVELNDELQRLGLIGGRVNVETPQTTASRRLTTDGSTDVEADAERAAQEAEQQSQQEQQEQQTETDQQQQQLETGLDDGVQQAADQFQERAQETIDSDPQFDVDTAQQVVGETDQQTEQQTEQRTEQEIEREVPQQQSFGQQQDDVDQQVAEQLPEPDTQPAGTSERRSIRNSDGTLRPPGEILRDFRQGRIDQEELAGEARTLGIDVSRFDQQGVPPIDTRRLRSRLRRLLRQNPATARRIVERTTGFSPKGRRNDIVDNAMNILEQTSDPVRSMRDVLNDDFQGETAPRRRRIKDSAARTRLVSRIKTAARSSTSAKRNAVRLQMTDGSMSQRDFDQLFEPGNFELERRGSDQNLVEMAEAFGVDGINDLTETAPGDQFDLRGLVRELTERDSQFAGGQRSLRRTVRTLLRNNPEIALHVASEVSGQSAEAIAQQDSENMVTLAMEQIDNAGSQTAELVRVMQRHFQEHVSPDIRPTTQQQAQEASELGNAVRDSTETEDRPPFVLIGEQFDFMFDGNGQVMSVDELIEIEGGVQRFIDKILDRAERATNLIPEVSSEFARQIDTTRLAQLEDRRGQDRQRERAQLLRDVWKRVLEQAALEDSNLQRTIDNERNSVTFLKREFVKRQATQDINTIRRFMDLLTNTDVFQDLPDEVARQITPEQLASEFSRQIQEQNGGDITDQDRVEMERTDRVDGLIDEGDRIIRGQIDRWAETINDFMSDTDTRLEVFQDALVEAINDMPSQPVRQVINRLFDTGMIGMGSAYARQQNKLDTLMNTPDFETARASTSSQRGQPSLGEAAESAQELSEQQLSDIIFKKVFNAAAFRFRGHNAFRGNQPVRNASGESQPVTFESKNPDGNSAHPDNQPLSDTHDVFILDFETYYDDAYNLDTVNQDYQAFIDDDRFEATVLTVRDPNTGEIQTLEGQQQISDFLESFKGRTSNRPVAFVAHNAPFDNAVSSKLSDFDPDMWLDTKQLAGQLEQFQGSLSLENIGERWNLQNRKLQRSALENTKGVRDLTTLPDDHRATFFDYAVADTATAGELFDIVEKSTPISALRINDSQTRLLSNPQLAREQPERLRFLAENGGFTTRSISRESNRGEQGRSIENTRLAGGQNLLEVPIRQKIGTAQDEKSVQQSNYVDAISLAQFTQTGVPEPFTPVEALANLESNLARLEQGPQSDIDWAINATERRDVPDSTVVWFNNGAPLTAGEIRSFQREQRDRDAEVSQAQDVVQESQEELRLVEHQLVQAIEGLENYLFSIGNDELGASVQLFRVTDFGDTRELKRQVSRARDRLVKLSELSRRQDLGLFNENTQAERDNLTAVGINSRFISGLDGLFGRFLDSVEKGDVDIAEKRKQRIIRRLQNVKGKVDAKTSSEINNVLENLERIASVDSAVKRISDFSQFRSRDGSKQKIQLPDGANASIGDLISRRFDILGRLGRANDFLRRNRDASELSQQREGANERSVAASQQLPDRVGPNESEFVDPDTGEVRVANPADDSGVDSTVELTRLEEETANFEDDLAKGLLDDATGFIDGSDNDEGPTETLANDIGTNQDQQPAQLFNQESSRAERSEDFLTQRREADNLNLVGISQRGQSAQRNRKAGANVRKLGNARSRSEFSGLEQMTKKLLQRFTRRNPDSTIGDTPIAIIETFDRGAIDQLKSELRQQVNNSGSRAERLRLTDQIAALERAATRPSYININGQVVITMDRPRSDSTLGVWQLTFAHELGHMVYDQSWMQADEATRREVVLAFQEHTGSETFNDAEYNGKTGTSAFKEWFADQMGTHLVEESFLTKTAQQRLRRQRDQGNRSETVQAKSRSFFQSLFQRLQDTWQAIQDGLGSERLARFTKNSRFTDFASRIINGEIPLSHRTDTTSEALHFTPDTADTQPAPKNGTSANAKRALRDPSRFKPNRLYRNVIGRIKDYNSRLAGLLFQQSQSNQQGTGSFENKRFTFEGRWAQWLEQSIDRLGGKTLGRAQVVSDAYSDLINGRDTNGARELRRLIDNIRRDAEREGWRDQGLGENFIPQAFDHQTVQAKRGDLLDRARQQLPDATDQELNDEIDRVINGFGMQELTTSDVTAPGNPVGTQRNAREFMDALGRDWLAENGFLNENGAGVVRHFISGLAKRGAWESVFGKDVLDTRNMSAQEAQVAQQRFDDTGVGPVRYDPSGTFREMLAEIRRERGDNAANEVVDLVDGAIGNKINAVNGLWRKSQDWMIGLTNLMILGFSGIATIPEFGLSAQRANMGISDVMRSVGDVQEARRLAKDLGIVMTTGAEQMQRMTAGEGYQSGVLQKTNSVFFEVNGQNIATRLSRTLSTAVGTRFILKAAAEGDHSSLQRLGLDVGAVRRWDAAGQPGLSPDMDGQLAQDTSRISQGLNQFVSDSTLRPSKFQATGWGNNPYLKVAWYLKQFLWTFGDTIIGGVARGMTNQFREARNQGFDRASAAAQSMTTPVLTAAFTMPLALMSIGLRDLASGDDEERDPEELTFEALRRSGAFGQWELAANMWDAYQWDNPRDSIGERTLNFGGAFAPPISQVDRILHFKDDIYQPDLKRSANAIVTNPPLLNQWKGTWQWLYE